MATLYEDINSLVEARIEKAYEAGELVDLPDLASEMAESLADLIVTGCPPEAQATLIAYTFEQLGYFIRIRREGSLGEHADGDEGKLN